LNKADVEVDQTKRADLYKQAQDLYADLVVTLPLFFNAEHVVYQNYIKGTASLATPETLNIGPSVLFLYSTISKGQ
jgi:ABC-type transport system substrate-binding protein